MEEIILLIAGGVAIVSAILVVSSRTLLYSALSLLLLMISQAIMFFALKSTYLGTIQLLVYAGGVVVLFILVISLVGSGREESLPSIKWWAVLSVVLLVIGGVYLLYSIGGILSLPSLQIIPASAERLAYGVVMRNVIAFEAVTLLLISALIGAIIFGRRKDD